jgi:uncharacterized protein HemX
MIWPDLRFLSLLAVWVLLVAGGSFILRRQGRAVAGAQEQDALDDELETARLPLVAVMVLAVPLWLAANGVLAG